MACAGPSLEAQDERPGDPACGGDPIFNAQLLEPGALHFGQSLGRAAGAVRGGIELGHEPGGFLVGDGPEGQQQVLGSRLNEAAPQAQDAFSSQRFTQSGIAVEWRS